MKLNEFRNWSGMAMRNGGECEMNGAVGAVGAVRSLNGQAPSWEKNSNSNGHVGTVRAIVKTSLS